MKCTTPDESNPIRTWPTALALLFLATFTAKMLSGSTPVIVFFTNPLSFFGNILLYGLGALLIREVAARRGLGWAGILGLGAAYGIWEEGLVVNTWANPWAEPVCTIVKGVQTGLCDYSRLAGINWIWALELTTFHAIVSITIPILLVKLVFSQRYPRPSLSKTAVVLCLLGELLALAGGLLINFATFRQHAQPGPLLIPYLIEAALMGLFILIALRLKPRGGATADGSVPKAWPLRLAGCALIAFLLLSPGIFQGTHLPFPLTFIVIMAVLAFAGWRINAWSGRTGWGEPQVLALASGALGFFLVFWDPLLEIMGQAGGKPTRGTLLVAIVYLAGLIVLTLRVNRRAIVQSR
jgi:hypothetical protein